MKSSPRSAAVLGISLIILLCFVATFFVGSDSLQAVVAAVVAIAAAATLLMVSDSASVETSGDRAVWLSLGLAMIVRATAGSIQAVSEAQSIEDEFLPEISLGAALIASLIVSGSMLTSWVRSGRSWVTIPLDGTLVAIAAMTALAIAQNEIGLEAQAEPRHRLVGFAAVASAAFALVMLGNVGVPLFAQTSTATWLLGGWLLTVVADFEAALSMTTGELEPSTLYFMSALAAFTLGMSGIFRLTREVRDQPANDSSRQPLTSHRTLAPVAIGALSCGFVAVIAFQGMSSDVSELVIGLATAGAIVGLLRLARFASRQGSEVETLQDRQHELELQAMTDSVTELPNHRALLARLAEEVERAKRFKQPLSVCFIDVDAFKQINDSLGHQAGDAVLKEIGSMLRANARQIDIVGRYGGEEFVILLPGTWTDDALLFAERLREAIAITVIRHTEEIDVRLSVSIGVAGLPEHANDRESLLKRADEAVYFAKRTGRNQVHLFNPNFDIEKDAAFTTEDAMRLVRLVEQRQPMSAGHADRVARLAAAMASRLGLEASEIDRIYQAAFFHDLGKISVPDSILGKDGPLIGRELEIVRNHPVVGARLLETSPSLVPLSSAVRHHHERWDGTGYPYRLGGENIPVGARIIAIADAYVSMTTASPWRTPKPEQDALSELQQLAGRQFDPKLVELFSRTVRFD